MYLTTDRSPAPLVAAAIAALGRFTVTATNAPFLLALWPRVGELSADQRAAVLGHFGRPRGGYVSMTL